MCAQDAESFLDDLDLWAKTSGGEMRQLTLNIRRPLATLSWKFSKSCETSDLDFHNSISSCDICEHIF